MTKFPEITRMAILSATVLPEAERDSLWNIAGFGLWLLQQNVEPYDEGDNILISARDADDSDMAHVTVYVSEDPEYNDPATHYYCPVLVSILKAAQEEGLQYVRFDRDGDPGEWPIYPTDAELKEEQQQQELRNEFEQGRNDSTWER